MKVAIWLILVPTPRLVFFYHLCTFEFSLELIYLEEPWLRAADRKNMLWIYS